MVLFSCTFSGLKAKSFLRYKINPDELKLEGERRLFQAYGTLPLHQLWHFLTVNR